MTGKPSDDGEVVGDQHHRHPQIPLKLPEFIQNLFLDCHVERGGRFVGNQQFWAGREGHGDHDTLLHAAA